MAVMSEPAYFAIEISSDVENIDPSSLHNSALASLTSAKMPLSAPIEGEKKYSPPLGTTKALTAFNLTALLTSCGNMPITSTCSLLLSWPRTASKPVPGLRKSRSFAHWPCRNAKPLEMVLW